MKILLIYPFFLEERVHEEEIAAVPIGVYYVAALLKDHGYDVEVINWHGSRQHQNRIRQTLLIKKPDIIGFSIVHANRWGGIDIARLAKSINPDVKVVFGGIGATFLWRHLLTHFEHIDYVVLGEGERTFLELVRTLECRNGHSPALDTLPGLALRVDGKPFKTAPVKPIENLDQLPPPARYFDFQHIAMTRGCPGRCSFCGSVRFWGRRVRSHSVAYFVNQLELLSARGITFLYFSDDTFTLKPKRVIQVCREIIRRGLKITWQAISKVNSINDDMLYWMRKAGCIQISFGVESGAPEIRNLLCKDIQTKQIRPAFKSCVRYGILARAYFIYGAPGETWQTINATMDLISQIKPLSVIFYIMTLFPGTELYENYLKKSGLTDDIWLQRIEDLLYFESDPGLDKETILAFGKRLRQHFQLGLPEFALDIKVAENDKLKAQRADFLSRLALTFSHGDYSNLQSTPAPLKVARILFERALNLCPDHRAFWGLALIYQQKGLEEKAETLLKKGLKHFPGSKELTLNLANSYFKRADYRNALDVLIALEAQPEVWPQLIHCYQALGNMPKARSYFEKLQANSTSTNYQG
ncbi:MAG: radical SAM protein [Desulfobacteraceae bacterium]|nr:radical SAM protein [Desulfobacteraceae bacterium]